ncbi:MAG: hypothetical protein OZSIB_3044 [Candidatus Ozemobacter sibiricus]|uniref:Putative restriction endonuclease domain-containing protein n=1 Tax=Candidatus Ozemobacter sibiricus TaxID=2268124 RepID=A0A367ZTR5_9BACT|nr:MAG: hypothetical protein OZSIB_3044 [Candidatus Ozemobacter sibiricus]
MSEPRRALPTTSFTYGDYLVWPSDERWELIDGEAFDMSAAPSLDHQEMLGELGAQLRTFLRGKSCRVFLAPDVILPRGDEADAAVRTVVRPDLAVVCDPAKMDGKRIRGAPDLVIEILSPATASHDCLRKRRVYEKAGVREFWLVHPVDRIVTVFRRTGQNGFGPPDYYDADSKVPVSVVPGLEVDLSLLFPPLIQEVRESPRQYGKPPTPTDEDEPSARRASRRASRSRR